MFLFVFEKLKRLMLWGIDREKVMRSLKTDDSAIISGMQIHHNYLRPHSGIDGKTPAEASCIKVEGNNKWITLFKMPKNLRPHYTEENRSPRLHRTLCS